MKCYSVYITAANAVDAKRIGRELVESRMAACVNILDQVNSIYWWDGKVQDDHEAALIAKTTEDRLDQLVGKVKNLHTYSCPCVVAWPIEGGNGEYLDWVRESTRKQVG